MNGHFNYAMFQQSTLKWISLWKIKLVSLWNRFLAFVGVWSVLTVKTTKQKMIKLALFTVLFLVLHYEADAKNWALLVAGSNGWYNYRHQVIQTSICRFYIRFISLNLDFLVKTIHCFSKMPNWTASDFKVSSLFFSLVLFCLTMMFIIIFYLFSEFILKLAFLLIPW